uniref:arylamine N-acetyltransferase, pineal gland isozyme NAT-3-like isoform X1 n=1 Tax=Styela clava TaxID=7725 RepID=UPI001939F876|nr:arylamine N-acetyltransferase, pineal gland isozyme NAT-3-like isoform X1 [Styela clava]XP_039254913.1 arylamine N-acetyltransferase, pineal gland isozyme NAT-3-like isoform X2 [Styela clava]
MEVEKLLKRMNYCGPIDHTSIDILNELCLSFVSTIPYETLDNFAEKKRATRPYDLKVTFNRIVNEHRGGNCLELNMTLEWMLEKLGYNVSRYMGYGYDVENDCFGHDRHHVILLVTFEDGMTWLTDVGWNGASFVLPLLMHVPTLEQSQPSGIYKVAKYDDGYYVVEKRWHNQVDEEKQIIKHNQKDNEALSRYQTSKDWMVIYGFKLETKPMEEFEKAFVLSQEKHPFTTSNCLAILQDRYHRRFMNGYTFVKKIYVNSMMIQVEKRKCENSELIEILRSEFGINLGYKLQPKTDLPLNVA